MRSRSSRSNAVSPFSRRQTYVWLTPNARPSFAALIRLRASATRTSSATRTRSGVLLVTPTEILMSAIVTR